MINLHKVSFTTRRLNKQDSIIKMKRNDKMKLRHDFGRIADG